MKIGAMFVISILAGLVLLGCGGGSALPAGVSAACNSAWTANESPTGAGGKSDELMAVTFTACSTYAEWEAGFRAHPASHGTAIEAETFAAVRCSNPDSDLGDITRTPVCLDRAAKGL